jgi:hypothetical protein
MMNYGKLNIKFLVVEFVDAGKEVMFCVCCCVEEEYLILFYFFSSLKHLSSIVHCAS